MTGGRDHPGIYVPPPLLYVVPFAGGVALHRAVGGDAFPVGTLDAALIAGFALAGGGVLLALWAEVMFLRAHTSPIPVRPARALVMAGPYRFTRNPMYVGLGLLYVGLALIVGYAWPLALFPLASLAVHRCVIPREERYLEEKFGESYRRYRETVRRWL